MSPARWRAIRDVHFGAMRARFDAHRERYAPGAVELDRRQPRGRTWDRADLGAPASARQYRRTKISAYGTVKDMERGLATAPREEVLPRGPVGGSSVGVSERVVHARWGLWLLAALAFAFIVRCAWLGDDAYITLRVSENLVHGRGPVYNAGERVQAYTNPLWMFLLAAVLPVVRDPYIALMSASLAVSALFLAVFVTGHAIRGRSGALALLVLAGSKSFVDYSASGLENPLSHLIVAWGFHVLWNRPAGLARLRHFALATSVAGLDRLDLVLLFLPALLVEARSRWVEHPRRRVLSALALGLAPLAAWEVFSLVYYGALVPNTAYAKLATGIPIGEYVRRGWYYLRSTAGTDPAGILALLVAPVAALAVQRSKLGGAAAGVLLSLVYVFRVGGDYMVGRSFTPLIVLASCILARAELAALARRVLVLVFLAAAVLPPLAPWRSGSDYDVARVQSLGIFRPVLGIMDERGIFYSTTGLLRAQRTRWNDHEWVRLGEERSRAFASDTTPVLLGPLGIEGFHAGPRVPVHDYYGLTDPLLARLPLSPGFRWRIGHFLRAPPAGYQETLASGRNRLRDPDVAAYYDLLQQVTRGELGSPSRWSAMWKIHFGAARARFDAYRERYASGTAELDPRPR